MTSKPENQYINKIGKLLLPGIHAEKTHNPFRKGVPDMYYESKNGILWVEYKWIPQLPVRATTIIRPKLEPLQLDWLRRAYDNRIPCAVIIGVGKGVNSQGIWFDKPDDWGIGKAKEFCALRTNRDMAFQIVKEIKRTS